MTITVDAIQGPDAVTIEEKSKILSRDNFLSRAVVTVNDFIDRNDLLPKIGEFKQSAKATEPDSSDSSEELVLDGLGEGDPTT